MNMSWTPERRDGTVTLQMPNVLIATNREDLKHRVLELTRQGQRRFVFDFAETRYIDSSGLGVLVSLTKAVRRYGGELWLTNLNEDLRTLLAATKLDSILPILGDADNGDGSAGCTSPIFPVSPPPLHGEEFGSGGLDRWPE
jgi:anti-anti-sigma factor